jgi:hypothetical protein
MKLSIAYHIPSLDTIYAGRTIYFGYKHAIEALGHKLITITSNDNFSTMLDKHTPDILMTGLNPFNLKYINLKSVLLHRKRGMRVFVNTPLWLSPISRLRISESPSLSTNNDYIRLIKSDKYGDVYYNVCESGDPRMDGFEKITGHSHVTIPLAADKSIIYPEYSERFKADISYIGTNLPEKRHFFRDQVYPLGKQYKLKLYGQDWRFQDRLLGNFQKVGQYFNIPLLRNFIKPKLRLENERQIYTSSIISINIHEDYQKKFGGDCNERTFKIPLSEGFEIVDNVNCIKKYFVEDKEMIIAKDKNEWFEKIAFYIKYPEKRLPIISAGKKRVLKDHTYHNRVEQIIKIYNTISR